MGFTKPSDIAMIFGIFALVTITVGFGIQSVVSRQNQTAQYAPLYTTVEEGVSTSYTDTTNQMTDIVTNPAGASETPSQDNIIVRGYNSVIGLGNVVKLVMDTIESFFDALGLNIAYVRITIGMIIVVFAVVTYTWFRGGSVVS